MDENMEYQLADAKGRPELDHFYVEIVAYDEEEVIEQRGPFTQWRANKFDDGLNINLNHEKYFTRVVSAQDAAAMLEP